VYIFKGKGPNHGGFQSCLTKVGAEGDRSDSTQKALVVMRVHTDVCDLWLKIYDCIWTVSGTVRTEIEHWEYALE